MTSFPPALALSLVLIVLSAFLFHALFGRSTRGLVATIIVALLGFVFGEMIARLLGHGFGMMGNLHMAHGLLGTWVAMPVARYMSA